MRKIEKFVKLLIEILDEVEKEKVNPDSLWHSSLLDNVVVPEISQLLKFAKNGVVYFKYGKKQRRLESTYFILDSMAPLDSVLLGQKILKLQQLYRKL
ncbi:hypothetical protein [Acholeplasma laidlawii]|uniref:hypothetical protein n=1 Tax=Acholeplasma laidlawii TaxID=2148 RepID=UPI0025414C3E|nr:hypothetical protein QOL21_08265 [Acholeplasma laidlawii]